ncbi:hypothetical protein [Rossellomorea sp. NS-SX7]|uniref:hypothetical protein n=1 Tax=Rossellomorea sp. NS-SX7 TaxID=3463856 RepID=UPI004059E9E5
MGFPVMREGVEPKRETDHVSSKQLNILMNIVGISLLTGFSLMSITVPLDLNGAEVVVLEKAKLHGGKELYSFVITVVIISIIYFSLVKLYFAENGKRLFMGAITVLAFLTVLLFFIVL